MDLPRPRRASLPISEHENLAAAERKPEERESLDPEIREQRSPKHESEEEEDLFQGVDPRALAAVLLQALDHSASPPAPGVLQQPQPPPQQQQQAEALLTETVRSQTHSRPAPEIGVPPTLSRNSEERSSESSDPSEELEALESLLQELRSFSPGNAKREPEAAAAEAETHTHTLTRVNLESPGPERVWRASWGEFQARVPHPPPFPHRFQEQLLEGVSLPEVRQGESEPILKTRQGENIASLYKVRQIESAPFSKMRRPESAAMNRLPGGGRLLQRGLAQVEAGRRQAEATRQAAAQEERLADLASDLLLQYLLQGGGGLERGVGDSGLQGEGEEEREREREEEEEGEIRGGEEATGRKDLRQAKGWNRYPTLGGMIPRPQFPFLLGTLLPPFSSPTRHHHYHAQPAEGSRYHFGLGPQGRRDEEEEEKQQQEEEELENYIEHVLLRRPSLFP
ncbi:neurosecretory protein VGF [Sarcophilus harrisii]|uniref:neurosecretory protein VGF n=1 Tax=Sarcophilus harrisii TaxID=9305 RepID=UPI001301AD6B|nr:neurosecretory protein VGF [Sarcophilus harrisii]